jgi:hypothetical protein
MTVVFSLLFLGLYLWTCVSNWRSDRVIRSLVIALRSAQVVRLVDTRGKAGALAVVSDVVPEVEAVG